MNALGSNRFAATSQLVIGVGYDQNNDDRDDARFFASNNLAFPAGGFRDVGGFDESFKTSEDRELCARWVLSGRRLAWERAAIVEHASPLTLGRFWRQHVAYGRGAYRYHATQSRRDARVRLEPSFYAALVRAALRRRPREAAVTLALLRRLASGEHRRLSPRVGRRRALPEPPGGEAGTVLHVTWSGRIGGIERSLSTLVLTAAERGGRASGSASWTGAARSATCSWRRDWRYQAGCTRAARSALARVRSQPRFGASARPLFTSTRTRSPCMRLALASPRFARPRDRSPAASPRRSPGRGCPWPRGSHPRSAGAWPGYPWPAR